MHNNKIIGIYKSKLRSHCVCCGCFIITAEPGPMPRCGQYSTSKSNTAREKSENIWKNKCVLLQITDDKLQLNSDWLR